MKLRVKYIKDGIVKEKTVTTTRNPKLLMVNNPSIIEIEILEEKQ